MQIYLLGMLIGISMIIMAIRIKTVRKHAIREPGLWRGWLTINDPDYMRRGVDYHLEVAYGKRAKVHQLGFKIHLGDRGSETPFHFNLYLFWVAIFFSMNTPRMGDLFEWIGRGHKRNISLHTHNGALWWELWYDDDMGYDNHHWCDGWRNLRWWPFKNKKYRSWACIRHGNIDLNPLDAIWGNRYYNYEEVGAEEDLFGVYQWDDDFYNVKFILQKVTRARLTGPKWVRRSKDLGYSVEWDCKEGIPVQNHDWKGDCVYSSAVKIDHTDGWVGAAQVKLIRWVLKERERNNFLPPTDPRLEAAEEVREMFASAMAEVDGEPIDLKENEKLKEKYTPAELHLQAINRDKLRGEDDYE